MRLQASNPIRPDLSGMFHLPGQIQTIPGSSLNYLTFLWQKPGDGTSHDIYHFVIRMLVNWIHVARRIRPGIWLQSFLLKIFPQILLGGLSCLRPSFYIHFHAPIIQPAAVCCNQPGVERNYSAVSWYCYSAD